MLQPQPMFTLERGTKSEGKATSYYNDKNYSQWEKSEDTFSSGVSSNLSESELASIDEHIQHDRKDRDKILNSFDSQLLREFQNASEGKFPFNADNLGQEKYQQARITEAERYSDPVYK